MNFIKVIIATFLSSISLKICAQSSSSNSNWFVDFSVKSGIISNKSYSVVNINAALARRISNTSIGAYLTFDEDNLYTGFFPRGGAGQKHNGQDQVFATAECYGAGLCASYTIGKRFFVFGAAAIGYSHIHDHDTIISGGSNFLSLSYPGYQSGDYHTTFYSGKVDFGWNVIAKEHIRIAPTLGIQRMIIKGFDPYTNFMFGVKLCGDIVN